MQDKKRIASIGISVFIILSVCFSASTNAFFKKATRERGFKIQLDIDELAAVNFMFSGDGAAAEIHGESGALENTLLSGKNHNVDGSLASGEKPAIRLNLSSSIPDVNEITLEGTPVKEGNYEYKLDMTELAVILRKNADITITQNTVLEGAAIGSPSNYQIVYLDNAQLILSHNFTGYGILYIEDSTYFAEDPIFEMLGNASWYGLIVINQHIEEDKDSKIFLHGSTVMNLENFVLLGINNLTLGDNLVVNNGSVGTQSEGGTVIIGNNSYFADSIIGDTINIGNNAAIEGDIYYTSGFSHGDSLTLNGDEITPSNIPLVDLPEFPEFEAGSQNISVGNNSSYTLAPGSYGSISIGNSSTLYLAGGIYNIKEISGGNGSRIKYQGFSEIRVKEKIEFQNSPVIEPDSVSLNASDCIFYIEGKNYPGTEDVFYAKNTPIIHCNIYAPNSSVTIKNNGDYKGSIIANTVTSENNAATSIELQSAFSTPPRYVKVYGSVICCGNNFHIPNLGNNAKVYYSRQALEQVNAMLDSLPLAWSNWKEVE